MTLPVASQSSRLSPDVDQTFPKLTPSQIERVAAHGRARRVERGEVLGTSGRVTPQFFVVRTGTIEVLRPTENGKTTIVTAIGPGEFTGEVTMLSGPIAVSFVHQVLQE
jgi:thioredoxin reductase (NADPH)